MRWHTVKLDEKWALADDAGRIKARITFKDDEYKASVVNVDAEGVGHARSIGSYISLEFAQDAINLQFAHPDNAPVAPVAVDIAGAGFYADPFVRA
jgi:hypothetical protein